MPLLLVVEDDPLVAQMLRDWLQALDHAVLGPATSLAMAMELAARRPPDGAVLDVSLREGDVYPLADLLRGGGVPFAFATGHGETQLPQRFANTPVLIKPFSFAKFKTVIANLLRDTAPT